MTLLAGFLLAASVDGAAALRHASALASLGPHAWGSPRNEAAALYVASQLGAAGLGEVELVRFERGGIQGTNVVATLRAPGEEFLLVAAHHDAAPGSPGAYDDGGGVGILIELARVLAHEASRTRTIVFASFDGEESWATGKGTTAGSRAYMEALGPRARSLVAAFAIEMSGWRRGTPLIHPIAYADPTGKARYVVAPGWLVRAALQASQQSAAPLGVGDPYLSWLYQPAVRTFRARLYGDDISVLQAGRPALFASDSSFTAFYPNYHKPADTPEQLDATALARMGTGVLGIVRALERVPPGQDEEPQWFAAFGQVIGWPLLLGIAGVSLLPVLAAGVSAGGASFALRLLQAVLFGLLVWREPVPILWVFLLPNLLAPLRRRFLIALVSLTPFLALVALGTAAWWRGAVSGVFFAPWEIAVGLFALVLSLFGLPARRGSRSGGQGNRRSSAPAGRRRR